MLEAGEWLCDDVNAAELSLLGERGTSTILFVGYEANTGLGTKSLLLVRSGAIGDLLYLSPVIARLKEEDPELHIALSCFQKHHEVVCDLGVELLAYPLRKEEAGRFRQVLSLENVMELNHEKHATDAFADRLSVEVKDYRPVFNLSEFERGLGEARFPRERKIRIGVQCRSSTANRDYPLPQWREVFEELTKNPNVEIFLFGAKGQLPAMKETSPQIRNLTEEDLTFRQSAAALATCDVFCGVDSSLLPLCHALDIPAVGLYAAFDWKTRTAKAPRTWALTGLGECAPCNWIKHAGHAFPPTMPCAKQGVCGVLASITPDRIVTKIRSLL